jgi:CRISPR-associated protein Cmr6
MIRPLYQMTVEPAFAFDKSHSGLWFDKFCNQWCRDSQKNGLAAWSLKAFSERQGKDRRDINPKLDWIHTVTRLATTEHPLGDQHLITELTTRLAGLARALGGQSFLLKTTNRLATGLGREHPIENGFAWHPVLGTPYLPGSSVKGLVRAWLEGDWCDQPVEPVTFHRIFGSDYRKGSSQHNHARDLQNQIGSVLFLDALPAAPVQLKPDVMTPHYGDYYMGKRDAGNPTPPADWLSPNPIPFLTVAPGQIFQFALAPRTRSAQDRTDCEKAVVWLQTALLCLGAGAKTAVGYGRFARPDAATAPADQPAQAAAARPVSPRYKPGQRLTVRRVEDPKGKGRVWFQADDGWGGVVAGDAPPQIDMGQTTELEIAAAIQGTGYNFRLPRTAPPPTRPHRKPRRQ